MTYCNTVMRGNKNDQICTNSLLINRLIRPDNNQILNKPLSLPFRLIYIGKYRNINFDPKSNQQYRLFLYEIILSEVVEASASQIKTKEDTICIKYTNEAIFY